MLMVILNLELDHILAFNNFHINFSYPRKLGHSLIKNENLIAFPSFRCKKLAIFVGSNATGKTSFIKCIAAILNFLSKKNKRELANIINHSYQKSYICMDFVDSFDEITLLHRMKIMIVNSSFFVRLFFTA